MNNSTGIIKQAEALCHAQGGRLTEKRKQVLESLLQSNKALSAYELIDACKENFNKTLPAMSVYRILEFLEDYHLVHKLNSSNKYIACIHISCDHPHQVPQFLICEKCHKVDEINVKPALIKQLQNEVKTAGYKLTSQQLEMTCLCEDCITENR